MCAIAGIINLDMKEYNSSRITKEKITTAVESMMNDLPRGGHSASGIFAGVKPAGWANTRGDVQLYKDKVPADKLLEHEGAKKVMDLIESARMTYVILHARAETSGPAAKNENNHPFRCGDIIGIHNGIINNDDELIRTEKLPMIGTCDSEVIFRLMDKATGSLENRVKEASKKLKGWYACAAVNTKDYAKIALFRKRAPIYLMYSLTSKTIIFSTYEEVIVKAIEAMGYHTSCYEKKELQEDHGMVIDTYNNNMWAMCEKSIFSLDSKTLSTAADTNADDDMDDPYNMETHYCHLGW